jgi:Ca-activated chloride channel family protein
MLEFDLPWMFALAPAPVLVWLVFPAYRERLASVRIPFFDELAKASGRRPERGAARMRRNVLQWIAAPVVWLLLVAALARPQWVEPPIEKIESARDLLLAIDVSQSMEARDFRAPDGRTVDRLEAASLVLDDFITRREGDRLGLIVFGGGAYLQAPLTMDHDTVRLMLEETRIGMAGPQTMIGDAIGLGIRMFESSEAPEKVLVLMTDGNDTGSRIPPEKAASLAAERGVTLYAIAIGDPATSAEKVDLAALESLASATGGRSYVASNETELAGVYSDLDRIQPQQFTSISYRPKRSLFQWPLGAAMVVIVAFYVVMFAWTGFRTGRVRHA